MNISRREFLKKSILSAGTLVVSCCATYKDKTYSFTNKNSIPLGFGPLRKDRKKVLDLPKGFSYKVISKGGDKMDDGFYVPHLADGMATFPGPDGLTVLLRNHEVRFENPDWVGPFKGKKKLWKKLDKELIFASADLPKAQHALEAERAFTTMMERFILFVRTEVRMQRVRYGAIFPALMKASHRKMTPRAG